MEKMNRNNVSAISRHRKLNRKFKLQTMMPGKKAKSIGTARNKILKLVKFHRLVAK